MGIESRIEFQRLRKHAGLSFSEVALLMSISDQQVRQYEDISTTGCDPSSAALEAIRKAAKWPSLALEATADGDLIEHPSASSPATSILSSIFAPLAIQPIPYQGSKRSLAPRICSLFPKEIETLYEPFAGSAAITLFVATHGLADRFVIGDGYAPLVDLWDLIINDPDLLSNRYNSVWKNQFDVGPAHFNLVREEFNETKDPILLLYLVARCVKNAVRFNKHGNFTQSVDKRRTGMKPDRVARTVQTVSRLLKDKTTLYKGDFRDCCAAAGPTDLIYMDPPYQGTTYGRDKRYAAGLDREVLISALHDFDDRGVQYVLSYDGQHGDKTYGEPLPSSVLADHLPIHAGRSSQATLSGRDDATIESLYVSRSLQVGDVDIFLPRRRQELLFA